MFTKKFCTFLVVYCFVVGFFVESVYAQRKVRVDPPSATLNDIPYIKEKPVFEITRTTCLDS